VGGYFSRFLTLQYPTPFLIGGSPCTEIHLGKKYSSPSDLLPRDLLDNGLLFDGAFFALVLNLTKRVL
jgi:hypothetical protein